jgi:hypothetical protein
VVQVVVVVQLELRLYRRRRQQMLGLIVIARTQLRTV